MSDGRPREGRAGLARPLRRFVAGPAALVALLVLWLAVARTGWVGRTLLADPLEVLGALGAALAPGAPGRLRLFAHAAATLERALAGWGLAVLLGVAGGLVAGARRWAFAASEPLVELSRSVPPILAFPLLLVVFDFGDLAYVGTIVFGCVPVVVLTVARARLRASPERIELLRVFGVPRAVRAAVGVMEVLPGCFLAARLALSTSLVISVVTEMVFAPRSGIALGALAKDAEMSFDTPVYFGAVVLVALFGYVANAVMRAVETRLGVEAP